MHRVISFIGFIFLLMPFASYAEVSGVVTDTDNSPVVDALVSFRDNANPNNIFYGYTNESGGYHLSLTLYYVGGC